jgi:hypothetical protein
MLALQGDASDKEATDPPRTSARESRAKNFYRRAPPLARIKADLYGKRL